MAHYFYSRESSKKENKWIQAECLCCAINQSGIAHICKCFSVFSPKKKLPNIETYLNLEYCIIPIIHKFLVSQNAKFNVVIGVWYKLWWWKNDEVQYVCNKYQHNNRKMTTPVSSYHQIMQLILMNQLLDIIIFIDLYWPKRLLLSFYWPCDLYYKLHHNKKGITRV